MKDCHLHHGVGEARFHLVRSGIWICIFVGLAGVLVCGVMLWNGSQSPTLDVRPERINPNTAAMGSLVRLPNIGKARAADVIAYRNQFEPGQTAFETVADLENIHGIGPKTVESLAPWLEFNAKDAKEANDASVQNNLLQD